MSKSTKPKTCPEERLLALTAGGNEAKRLREIDVLLRDYPSDPQLLFLKGSLLAGSGDYSAARKQMRKAVDVAPHYVLARFQLGFLELTSGEPVAAQESWGPLHALPPDHFIRAFVEGLCHLIRDEFADTIRCLERGIAKNQEIPAMNRDMQLIIDAARGKDDGERSGVVSSVDLLLQQSSLKSRLN